MFNAASLLSALVLALNVAASPVEIRAPPVTLPFSKRVNSTGLLNLLENDLARARALRAHAEAKTSGKRAVVSFPVTNEVVSYIASVGVGSPATQYDLIVDTGSSNTWVGATKAYVRTSTSTQTNQRVSVTYGSGSFSGNEFTDQVTLASGLVIPSQSIGVATRSTGFEGVDGILGVGPVDLTEDTLSPGTTTTIPTVTDNLFNQGTITARELGVFFAPTNTEESTNGELTFGGVDNSKITGTVAFTPLTNTSPANEFWGINESIRYGTSTTIMPTTAGIVDTGTTLTLLPTDAFARYQSATGAVLDRNTGLLRLTTTQFANLQPLTFTTSGGSFTLTANAQAWPRALNTDIGGTAGNVYLIVNSIGTPSGEGLDFINGQTFLERFYSVFDTTNRRIGFATTAQTNANTN
ncbi:aspartic peptidase A1 [Punctularia strigosozonata HHB-11173 SS5]|uniref:aspartic peptidase A1 n=1 Tax=Punctularia strigosozonata (strain HHB-11173) TaxID=741275 RepID=UPI00044173D6|nr:aspartic peptidase A1 [Punctularia strigosozonata HHB-11173 SS5]EIN13874.1 aspartic peptidase A1 [Punctularia strigosozonata HHB-11173 SS5]